MTAEFLETQSRYRGNLTIAFEKYGFSDQTLKDINQRGNIPILYYEKSFEDESQPILITPLGDFVQRATYILPSSFKLGESLDISRITLASNIINLDIPSPQSGIFTVDLDMEKGIYFAQYVGPRGPERFHPIPNDLSSTISALPLLVADLPSTYAGSYKPRDKK